MYSFLPAMSLLFSTFLPIFFASNFHFYRSLWVCRYFIQNACQVKIWMCKIDLYMHKLSHTGRENEVYKYKNAFMVVYPVPESKAALRIQFIFLIYSSPGHREGWAQRRDQCLCFPKALRPFSHCFNEHIYEEEEFRFILHPSLGAKSERRRGVW